MRKEIFKILVVGTFSIILMLFVFSYETFSQVISIEDEAQERSELTETKKIKYQLTITGSGGNKLKEPINVIVSENGNVIVADKGDGQVKIFDNKGKFIASISGKSENDSFKYPYGLVLTPKGDLIVSDSENNTVQQFDITGNFIKEIISPNLNIRPGNMLRIDNQVYIADLSSRQILVFNLEGEQVSKIQANLSYPHGLALDRDRVLWIGDAGQIPSLKKLTVEGVLKNQYELNLNNQKEQHKTIRGLAIDSQNRIHVSDAMASKVLVFDSNGEFLYQIGGPGVGESEFRFPTGLFIDSKDRIYIADRMNKRIQVFSY